MKIYFTAILLLLSTVAGSGQWSYLGLSTTSTTDLTIYGDTIYASTYNGIYKKGLLSTDTLWSACGLQGNHVVQTLVPDYLTFICVMEVGSSRQTQIYKSINGGDSFTLMKKSLSAQNSYAYLDKIAHPEGNYDTLYFLDHRLRTYNGGVTWDTLTNISENTNRFIKLNPENHHQLFIGGETFILSAYIQTSTDRGDNWHFLPNMSSFFAGDNAIHDMIMDGNEWFAAGEGVIGKTSDGGTSWEQLVNYWDRQDHWSLYFTDIEQSPADKHQLYATGLGYFTDRVPLLHSSNHGIDWDTLSYKPLNLPAGTTTDITCMSIKNISGGDQVYLGGKGVYLYTNNLEGIPDIPDEQTVTIYPNPTDKKVTITLPSTAKRLQIINIQGKVVESRPVHGQMQLNMEFGDPGIYIIQITTDKGKLSRKVIVQ